MYLKKENFLEFEIIEYQILDSTNSEAKRLIEQNSKNLVIFSESQTKGRGRGGKEWQSEDGSLFFTLVLKPKIQPELYPLLAGYVLHKVFTGLNLDTKIKWPNDIYVNNKKLSGILTEFHKGQILIGIGINILSSPSLYEKETTSLRENNIDIDKKTLLKQIIKSFLDIENETGINGFENIKNEIEKNLFKLGEEIEVKFLNENLKGILKKIDINGNLILEAGSGTKVLNIGEIIE